MAKKELFSQKIKKYILWIFLLACLIFLFVNKSFRLIFLGHKNKIEINNEIKDLNATKTDLLIEIQKLKRDDKYIEMVAREKIGMIKDKELIYKFSDSSEN